MGFRPPRGRAFFHPLPGEAKLRSALYGYWVSVYALNASTGVDIVGVSR
jgi:hypothetical protein